MMIENILIALMLCIGCLEYNEMRNKRECKWISYWCMFFVAFINILGHVL